MFKVFIFVEVSLICSFCWAFTTLRRMSDRRYAVTCHELQIHEDTLWFSFMNLLHWKMIHYNVSQKAPQLRQGVVVRNHSRSLEMVPVNKLHSSVSCIVRGLKWDRDTGQKLQFFIPSLHLTSPKDNGCECFSFSSQSSSSRMRVIYHNWSATKQRPHPQSVAEISCHSVLSGDRIRRCETFFAIEPDD